MRIGCSHGAAARGFTMVEVMVSLLVFVIAVVGLVSMESRGLEAQRASMEIREAERIAQQAMADLQSTGFTELVRVDFAGGVAPNFPYSDAGLQTHRVVDFRAVPSDGNGPAPGRRPQVYWLGRSIDRVPENAVQPAGDPALVDALQLAVDVLWLDYTNPAFPPPETAKVEDLRPENLDPLDPNFLPYVSGVRVRTVRVNDWIGP